jgi:hypothetical protein
MAISPEDAATLTGFFEAADAVRSDMHAKWGTGRLEALCGAAQPAVLARFRRQQATFRAALEAAWTADFLTRDALALVEQKTGSMQRAWTTLDSVAEEAGHRPIAPWVWECVLEDGSICALVQSDAEAGKVIAEGRHVHVYTVKEIATVLQALPQALKLAKVTFPGAKLQMPDPYRRSKDPIPWDDPIPFGDAAVSEDEAPF